MLKPFPLRNRARMAFALACVFVIANAASASADTPESNTDFSVGADENSIVISGNQFSQQTTPSTESGPSSSVVGGSGGGSAAGGGVPAVPAASGGSGVSGGGSSRGGVGGPLEMVCTGEREGIPGSAARPGDAGAVSAHCQYVPGTAPTTPADEGEPAEEGGAGEGEAPSTDTIVRTALARVPVSGAGLSWQPRKRACQFFCVCGLEVGGDPVGVGGGELGEGLFPVGGELALDETGWGGAFAGGFALVLVAFAGAFVLDVADRQPQ